MRKKDEKKEQGENGTKKKIELADNKYALILSGLIGVDPYPLNFVYGENLKIVPNQIQSQSCLICCIFALLVGWCYVEVAQFSWKWFRPAITWFKPIQLFGHCVLAFVIVSILDQQTDTHTHTYFVQQLFTAPAMELCNMRWVRNK